VPSLSTWAVSFCLRFVSSFQPVYFYSFLLFVSCIIILSSNLFASDSFRTVFVLSVFFSPPAYYLFVRRVPLDLLAQYLQF
jgi:hypothetical protein